MLYLFYQKHGENLMFTFERDLPENVGIPSGAIKAVLEKLYKKEIGIYLDI